MRMKLVALVSAAMLLAGCAASSEPEAEPAPDEAPEASATIWDGKDFCEAFEMWRDNYQDTLDNPDGVVLAKLPAFTDWADALNATAPEDVADAVTTFTAPAYITEEGEVDLMAVFMSGNEIARNCISAG